MIDTPSPLFPFNVCRNVFLRNSEHRRIKMRKGDMVEVPAYEEEPLSGYFDGRVSVNSSIQIRSNADVVSIGSYDKTERSNLKFTQILFKLFPKFKKK